MKLSKTEKRKIRNAGFKVLENNESIDQVVKQTKVNKSHLIEFLKNYPQKYKVHYFKKVKLFIKKHNKLFLYFFILISLIGFVILFKRFFFFAATQPHSEFWAKIFALFSVGFIPFIIIFFKLIISKINKNKKRIYCIMSNIMMKIKSKERLKRKIDLIIKKDTMQHDPKGAVSIAKDTDLSGGGLSLNKDKKGGLSKNEK